MTTTKPKRPRAVDLETLDPDAIEQEERARQVQQGAALDAAIPAATQRHQQQAAVQRDCSGKPKTKNEGKERHLSHSKAMACFDRCVVVQADRKSTRLNSSH